MCALAKDACSELTRPDQRVSRGAPGVHDRRALVRDEPGAGSGDGGGGNKNAVVHRQGLAVSMRSEASSAARRTLRSNSFRRCV